MHIFAGMRPDQAKQIDMIANKREFQLEKEHLQKIEESEAYIEEHTGGSSEDEETMRKMNNIEKLELINKRLGRKGLVSRERRKLSEKKAEAKFFLTQAGDTADIK